MAVIRFEVLRGGVWSLRGECEAVVSVDGVREQLGQYALQYPHRAFVDGLLVGTVEPGGLVMPCAGEG